MTSADDSVLRLKATALARSVWDEHRKTAVISFDTLSSEARDMLVDCCLKGMCVGMVAGSSLILPAQGIEAATADETGIGSAVGESPVAESDAPETSPQKRADRKVK